MTPPLTPQPDRLLEPAAAAKTTSTQLLGVLYITLTELVDSMVPNSRPWPLLGQSVSYIIKLAPILWWALPAGSAVPHPEPPKASTYNWLPNIHPRLLLTLSLLMMKLLLSSSSSCSMTFLTILMWMNLMLKTIMHTGILFLLSLRLLPFPTSYNLGRLLYHQALI
ncbi:hypothetical protein DSO57_1003271 [Entomophthora muscae]|uniref:Uncharacterized protein n=1 Tax=Entomophthora muscae TaxID=34485 RepID=A0ACC2SL64_9FUNG|nr:hypothetical protein DSO57_1003271 [Entomophthora muscae]